jgi:hypothetical protein
MSSGDGLIIDHPKSFNGLAVQEHNLAKVAGFDLGDSHATTRTYGPFTDVKTPYIEKAAIVEVETSVRKDDGKQRRAVNGQPKPPGHTTLSHSENGPETSSKDARQHRSETNVGLESKGLRQAEKALGGNHGAIQSESQNNGRVGRSAGGDRPPMQRSKSETRRRSWLLRSTSSTSRKEELGTSVDDLNDSSRGRDHDDGRRLSLKLRKRRSWILPRSSPPSPPSGLGGPRNEDSLSALNGNTGSAEQSETVVNGLDLRDSSSTDGRSNYTTTTKKGVVLTKKTKRLSTRSLVDLDIDDTQTDSSSINSRPPVPPLPKSFSTGDFDLLAQRAASSDQMPFKFVTRSAEKLSNLVHENSKKKDDLWSAFRSLDGNHQR